MSDDSNGNQLNKGIPLFIKLLVAAALVMLLGFGIIRIGGCKKRPADTGVAETPIEPDAVELPTAFPPPLTTQWPDVVVEIESVARSAADGIVVHWRYRNQAVTAAEPFSWGADQPNVVALTQLRDATGRAYPVAISGAGVPLCSSIRSEGRSAAIHGGRSLPAWALFAVPAEAVPPLELVLHGVTGPAAAGIKVPVLTAAEQAARAFVARETSWPDVWIQLDEVVRTAPGNYRVKWRYVNRNLAKAFSWSREQPDLPQRTELFDFATGSYRQPAEASSLHQAPNGGPTTIPAGGELPAEAVFENVDGDHFELIFHGALPVYYDVTN